MTRGQRLKAFWHRYDLYVGNALLVAISLAVGAGLMNWFNARERSVLIDRFPVVRAEERAACTREFSAQISGLQATGSARDELMQQVKGDMTDIKTLMKTTNELAAYTLRFLGDRAKVNDQRTTAMLKQTKEAAQAATVAAQKTEAVEQKVNVVAGEAHEAANTAKAVDKKLETATRPALPAKPWIGNQR
ncbi:hypothetical protein AX768_09275 [Burkholderia sp. PAMC 28687]|uniref:hypothetical protein n=1 Tax=Burkholderia sp. PAMC 28687 TaxID=1795874 RepID=UPI000780F36B|nr:hypothetical protein [Burkholderia sp. PAMC 28687]AMM14259.1 hypothetical protein AX768_09275 [Burkholderia sp. PAMC 28687]